MNPEQVALVQRTWSAVLPMASQAADLFYDRLFVLDPKLRPLFPDELGPQKQKLMAMLGRTVGALHEVDSIVPTLQELGRRHLGYGVVAGDYATVGAALLWTLEQGLGPETWTPPVRDSWRAAYALLSKTMLDAALSLENAASSP